MSDPDSEPAPSSPPRPRQSRLRRPREDEDESSSSGVDDDGDVVVADSAAMLDSSDGASQAGVVTATVRVALRVAASAGELHGAVSPLRQPWAPKPSSGIERPAAHPFCRR